MLRIQHTSAWPKKRIKGDKYFSQLKSFGVKYANLRYTLHSAESLRKVPVSVCCLAARFEFSFLRNKAALMGGFVVCQVDAPIYWLMVIAQADAAEA
jgi:hypothetical protein